MASDHYKTLGITQGATQPEVKSAYRRLVMLYHPDQNSDPKAAEKFLEVTTAYEILGDTDKRRNYDAILDVEFQREKEAKARVAQANARTNPNTRTSGTSGRSSDQRPGTRQDTSSSRTQGDPKAPQSQTAKPRTPTGPQSGPTSTRYSTPPGTAPTGPPSPTSSVAEDLTRLTLAFNRHQYVDSERLAREIISKDARQPVPYAILGDIYRAQGNYQQAAKMYAYAAQMDGRNTTYQQRYEELLHLVDQTKISPLNVNGPDKQTIALGVGALLVLTTSMYVAVAPEHSIMPGFGLLSSWTLGLMVMLFMSGVIVGSALSTGNMLDRFLASSTSATGRLSPLIALGSVAIVNFWAAAGLFAGLGLIQKAFHLSTTRLLIGVGSATVVMTLAAAISQSRIDPGQVFLWGGNLTYIGSIAGWMVADSFKR